MKVLVCGGRDYSDLTTLIKTLDAVRTENPITEIIHGNAVGADTLAGIWARKNGIRETRFIADWNKLGRSAGMIRNQRMLEYGPELVIAFPGGRGTANMIRIAKAANIPIIEIS